MLPAIPPIKKHSNYNSHFEIFFCNNDNALWMNALQQGKNTLSLVRKMAPLEALSQGAKFVFPV